MIRSIRIATLLLLAILAATWWTDRPAPEADRPGAASAPAPADGERVTRHPSFLPPEAVATLERIERGGPFPYARDGTVFQNREGLLPAQPRGYYREYTVETPGSPDRGARRIVAGGQPPVVYYYTDDHYRSFRPVEIEP